VRAQLAGGGSREDVRRAPLKCLESRETSVRWLLLEVPLLPKGFATRWIGFQSAVSHYVSEAAERDVAARRIREMPAHLLFNTWVGLLHHYVINRELFSPGRSVIAEHGETLLAHFLNLLSHPKGARR
jgi:hypothetical protein